MLFNGYVTILQSTSTEENHISTNTLRINMKKPFNREEHMQKLQLIIARNREIRKGNIDKAIVAFKTPKISKIVKVSKVRKEPFDREAHMVRMRENLEKKRSLNKYDENIKEKLRERTKTYMKLWTELLRQWKPVIPLHHNYVNVEPSKDEKVDRKQQMEAAEAELAHWSSTNNYNAAVAAANRLEKLREFDSNWTEYDARKIQAKGNLMMQIGKFFSCKARRELMAMFKNYDGKDSWVHFAATLGDTERFFDIDWITEMDNLLHDNKKLFHDVTASVNLLKSCSPGSISYLRNSKNVAASNKLLLRNLAAIRLLLEI